MSEPRKSKKRQYDEERYEDPIRQEYLKENVKKQRQKKLLSTYVTDTGFDLICSCCLQYKSEYACKSINVLSSKQQKEYTVKKCKLLESRSEGLGICNSCLAEIKRGKRPKNAIGIVLSFPILHII